MFAKLEREYGCCATGRGGTHMGVQAQRRLAVVQRFWNRKSEQLGERHNRGLYIAQS